VSRGLPGPRATETRGPGAPSLPEAPGVPSPPSSPASAELPPRRSSRSGEQQQAEGHAHGDPEGVVRTLVEFYSARLLGEDPDAVEPRLRRPGRTLTREDRDRAAAEARAQALAVAGDLFERRACATCHEVTRNDEAAIPWTVLEVRLTDRFFPHANFSHAAHATGVTRCDGCHDAGASTHAADLLIPGIESCRECHGSGIARRNSGGQIASTCVACHGFHDEAKGAAD